MRTLPKSLAAGLLLLLLSPHLHAQGTAFTYQGQLAAGTNPANGSYDLLFTLYNAATNGTALGSVTNSATAVNNGMFTATIDFGDAFNGSNCWLELAVSTNGAGVFTTLSPRQPVLPVPQAIYAASARNAAFASQATTAATATTASTIAGIAGANVAQLNFTNTTLQATGTVTVTSGFITSANVINGGSGYVTVPSVTVSDASGSNAVITATISNGVVITLTVQDPGSHYSAGATLTIGPPPSNAYQTFASGNVFTGVNIFNNPSNTFAGSFAGSVAGSFTGNGGSLTNLNAAGLTGTAGNFSVGTLTIAGNLDLPTASASVGVIYSGGQTLINSFGYQNFFAGLGAGNFTMSGCCNTANGYQALENNTSGVCNTANGNQALYNNTVGTLNTAIGNQALFSNTSGINNTACGVNVMWHNTSGYANTAYGIDALFANTTGNGNTANGAWALKDNTSGGNNTANGIFALGTNTTGGNNTAIGAWSLQSNTIGSNNTAIGYLALTYNTTGSYNTANGDSALSANTTGSWNTANGTTALGVNTTGNYNTANGNITLRLNTTGSGNTANGNAALAANATGGYNAANGFCALNGNTIGSDNTANGNSALYSNTTGDFNTASGSSALYSNTTGGWNAANGGWALHGNTIGWYNTANGEDALHYSTTGSNNTANGFQSLFNNTTASYNTADGVNALYSNTIGTGNVALGYQAGYNIKEGSNNIEIGNLGTSNDNNTIYIGTQGVQTNTSIAGIFGTGAASGVPVYVTSTGQLGTLTSSARFKTDIQSMNNASEVLLSLHPVTFHYKSDIDPHGIPQFGLVAEDVAKVDPDLVARDDKHRIYTVRYEAVNAMLLNEFLKEHRKVEEQGVENETLRAKVGSLEKKMDELQALVNQLAAQR